MFIPPRNEWRQFWSDFFDSYIVTNEHGVDSIRGKGNGRILTSLYNFSFLLICFHSLLPESLRNFLFLLLVIYGIEPHPGPLPELSESEQKVLDNLLELTEDGFSRVITTVMSSSARGKKQIIKNTGSNRNRTSVPQSKKEWDLVMEKCYRFIRSTLYPPGNARHHGVLAFNLIPKNQHLKSKKDLLLTKRGGS